MNKLSQLFSQEIQSEQRFKFLQRLAWLLRYQFCFRFQGKQKFMLREKKNFFDFFPSKLSSKFNVKH
jgi:hypothetical protein